MARRKQKPVKKIAISRNPLFNNNLGLEYDDYSAEESVELTDEQKTDKFLSLWLKEIHPFTKYSKFFRNNTLSSDVVLREVKNYHKKYVIGLGWSEKKYAYILDHIMSNNMLFVPKTIENCENLYDAGRLSIQQSQKKMERRGRI